MKSFVLLLSLLFTNNLIAHENDKPPQLWSSFKDLNKSKEACLTESFLAVSDMGIQNTTQNEYGFYGNIGSSRIVVKCLSFGSNKSKVMVAVAGKSRKTVEYLRNFIIHLIN